MNLDKDKQKAALTEQVIANLEKRLNAAKAEMAALYVEQFFRRVPIEELASEAPQTLASIVISQLEFLNKRKPGEMLIRVFNPDVDDGGWESRHTFIEVVNDDMPFLVDTAALTLSEMDLGVHLIIHPVIRFGRDDKGRLTSI
jgi:glutamate dehydrogenase